MDCGTEEIEDEENTCAAAKRAVDSEVGPGNRCLLKSSRHSIPNLRIRKPIPSSQAIAQHWISLRVLPASTNARPALKTKLLAKRITVLIVPIARSVCRAPASNPA